MQAMSTDHVKTYVGVVAQRALALGGVTHGGQIICDTATMEGVRPHLAELYQGHCHAVTQHGMTSLERYGVCKACALRL